MLLHVSANPCTTFFTTQVGRITLETLPSILAAFICETGGPLLIPLPKQLVILAKGHEVLTPQAELWAPDHGSHERPNLST